MGYRFSITSLFVFLLFNLFFIGCSRRTPNDLYVVKALKISLENSVAILERENEQALTTFQMKTQFPETREKAELLLPQMMGVKSITTSAINEIKKAQSDLIAEATSKDESEPFYYEDNLDAVKRLFIQKERAKFLFRKLKLYKTQLEAIDRSNKEYITHLLIDVPENEKQLENLDNFLEFFKYQPAISVDAFLESLKANILLNEKRMYFFISDKTTSHLNHNSTEILIGTNMRYFKSGDQLQITAGIAEFRYFSKSYMLVNGEKILPDERGRFIYDTKINKSPGNYQMPIEIGYVEADGNPQTLNKNIDYSVIK
ncbi:hypothetical protein ESA94_04570 [Lacibacter luteus]|uniref:Gliding motility-associated protein GldM N-terminal domain-containing protein n=1 Tax=Lacibacter luteus TaxID=2508719 RepID=A0A4Q1CMN4_9BACT|nr:hypothetical protein [Lacibacter luteus]RXK62290.1 hypothetical protein ESA94_04570 [Lacibacter luteus]